MPEISTPQFSSPVLIERLNRYLASDGSTMPVMPMEVVKALIHYNAAELRAVKPVLEGCVEKYGRHISADYENGFKTALDALNHRLKKLT